MNAIEVTGSIDAERRLRLDAPLPVAGPSRVRVIVLLPDAEDESEDEWQRAAAANPAFDFLKDEAEDIYSVNDGEPFNGQG